MTLYVCDTCGASAKGYSAPHGFPKRKKEKDEAKQMYFFSITAERTVTEDGTLAPTGSVHYTDFHLCEKCMKKFLEAVRATGVKM